MKMILLRRKISKFNINTFYMCGGKDTSYRRSGYFRKFSYFTLFFFFFVIIHLSMKITRTYIYNTFFPMIIKVIKRVI